MNDKSEKLGMRTMSLPSAFKAVCHILQTAMSFFLNIIFFATELHERLIEFFEFYFCVL